MDAVPVSGSAAPVGRRGSLLVGAPMVFPASCDRCLRALHSLASAGGSLAGVLASFGDGMSPLRSHVSGTGMVF